MKKKIIALCMCVITMVCMLTGCDIQGWNSGANDIKGQLTGVSFNCYFYDNNGNKFLTASGDKIGMTSNIVKEQSVTSSGGTESVYGMSSVVTLNIDGSQIQSCGDTIIFAEDGLSPDTEFQLSDIQSNTDGSFADNAMISNIVNSYKNFYGKPQVVVIQSQLGVPICAYSGDDVYWEVKDDLPKTTKLMIDGKALYIHRANFQIIDLSLIK